MQVIDEMSIDKAKTKVALQAKLNNKDKKGDGKWYGKRGRGNYHNNGDMDSQNFNKPIF